MTVKSFLKIGPEFDEEIKCSSSTNSSIHIWGTLNMLSHFSSRWVTFFSVKFGNSLMSSSLGSSLAAPSVSSSTAGSSPTFKGLTYLCKSSGLKSSCKWGVCFRLLWEALIVRESLLTSPSRSHFCRSLSPVWNPCMCDSWPGCTSIPLALCHGVGISARAFFTTHSVACLFTYFSLFVLGFVSLLFRRWNSYSIGLRSGDWLDQSKTFHLISLMKSFVVLAVCFGSLSCCMIKFLSISLDAFRHKLADRMFL